MKKIIFLLLAILLFGTFCNKEDEDPDIVCDECKGLFSEELTMWVNSELKSCTDQSDERCIMVQFGTILIDDSWEVFENEICGFEFEEGYLYKLEIQRKKDKDSENEFIYCLTRIVSMDKVFL